MDPISRGSQSPSPTVESDVSPPVLTPKEGTVKTPPTATQVSANKLQSYLPMGGEARESMCKAEPPPFSRAEPQGEELKLLEQVRHRQASASMGRGVELCKGPVDADYLRDTGFKLHHWLRTSLGEAGMGPDDGSVPGEGKMQTPIYSQTRLNDHTGRGEKPGVVCEQVKNVDEACVSRELAQLGKPLGEWTLIPIHNCQTYAADVLKQCSTEAPPPPRPPMFDPGKI